MDRVDVHKADGFVGEKLIIVPADAFQDFSEDLQISRMHITDVGYFPNAKNHYRERKEGCVENIYIYCTGGEGAIEVENEIFHLQQHEAFCIPNYMSHKYYASTDNPWSILWFHFKGRDSSLYPIEKLKVIPFQTTRSNNRIMFLFEAMFQVLEANYTLGNFQYIGQLISLILSETYQREKRNSAELQNKYITRIIRYMYSNLHTTLTMDDISHEFSLSKSYLYVIFRKYTNRAPLDFFLHLKMTEACKLLRLSDKYVYEVARELGYKDQYYFSRIFKKLIGYSPNEYKKVNS